MPIYFCLHVLQVLPDSIRIEHLKFGSRKITRPRLEKDDLIYKDTLDLRNDQIQKNLNKNKIKNMKIKLKNK